MEEGPSSPHYESQASKTKPSSLPKGASSLTKGASSLTKGASSHDEERLGQGYMRSIYEES